MCSYTFQFYVIVLEFKVRTYTKFILGHKISMCLLSEGMTEFNYIAFDQGRRGVEDEHVNYVFQVNMSSEHFGFKYM